MKNEVDFLKMVKQLCKHNVEFSDLIKQLPSFKDGGVTYDMSNMASEANNSMIKGINMRIELIRLKVL